MEAVVDVEGHAAVVEGGHFGLLDLAGGNDGVSDDLLGGEQQVVLSGLHGEDEVERVGNADLGERGLLLGSVNGQVEAGSLVVELETADDGLAVLGLLVGGGLLFELEEGQEGNLDQFADLGLSLLVLLGDIVVLDFEFDLVDGLGLAASALAGVGQLGVASVLLLKLLALFGIFGLAALFPLLVRNLGVSGHLDA